MSEWQIGLLIFAALAGGAPAAAYELGQSQEDAMAERGRAATVQPLGATGEHIMLTDDGSVLFCRGRVVSIQQKVGGTLHDFAATVQVEQLRRGAPAFNARNTRTGQGEVSTIEAVWREGENAYRVSMISYSGGTSVSQEQRAGWHCD